MSERNKVSVVAISIISVGVLFFCLGIALVAANAERGYPILTFGGMFILAGLIFLSVSKRRERN